MLPTYKLYKFKEFTVNPLRRSLFQGDSEVELSGKGFDVLVYLIENAPKFCSLDEIIKAVWNETNVTNNSVEKTITNIRKALGDDRQNPRFVKNERGKGYSFICDVQEIEQNQSSITYENLENAQPKKIEFASQSLREKTSNSKLLALCLVAIIVLLVSGVIWWKGSYALAKINTTTIFTDDFSGGEIDANRWTVKGKSVKVEDGIAKLVVEETDNWGKLKSAYFSFDPNKPLTIRSRIKVNYSRNIKNKTYFVGSFLLVPESPLPEERDDRRDFLGFGVKFANYDYETITLLADQKEEIKTEGFFLSKNGGRPHEKMDYAAGKVSKRIEPVWNQWFEQQIIYDPSSGKMNYFIDGELKEEFNVGELPPDLPENKLRVEITPWGWWLYHSIEVDYIEVTQ